MCEIPHLEFDSKYVIILLTYSGMLNKIVFELHLTYQLFV